jgi:surfeit locus 1 family protein
VRRKFRPKPVPAIIALLLFVTALALGFWQVQRAGQKAQLVAELEAAAAAPPQPLPAVLDNPEAWAWRRVQLSGRYRNDRSALLLNRGLGDRPGVHLLTPIERDGASPVLVDRGWLPLDSDPQGFGIDGTVERIGVVRTPEQRGGMGRFLDGVAIPPDEPARRRYFRVDPQALAGPAAPTWWIELVPQQEPGLTGVGGTQKVAMPPEGHRNYAFFWFTMAAVLVVIFVMSSMRGSSDR